VATLSGTFTGTGALQFDSGSSGVVTLTTSTATFTNPVSIIGGTVSFVTGLAVTLPSLTLTGGNLAGTDTVSVTGPFNWNSSGSLCTTLNSSGNCVAAAGTQGILNANGGISNTSGYTYLYGRTLNNAGAASFGSGYGLYLAYGAIVNNLAAGSWTLSSGSGIYTSNPGPSTFNNAGTFANTITNSSSVNPMTFNNSGTVVSSSGTLTFTPTTFVNTGSVQVTDSATGDGVRHGDPQRRVPRPGRAAIR
jgi:hypothetical protein